MTFVGMVRSELRKFFSTRLWWGMAIGMAVGAIAFTVLMAFVLTMDFADTGPGGAPEGTPTQIANSVYVAGLSIGYLLMLTIGVIQIGSEYRHRTITATFLASPRRTRAMLAKVAALSVIGALYGLVSILSSTVIGSILLNLRGADPFPSIDVLRTLALALLVLVAWAMIGLGIGILIPNQVAALLIGIGAAWIVEPLLGLLLSVWDFPRQHIVPFMPSSATNAVVDVVVQGDQVRLSWWAGALTLMAYAAVLAGLGIWRTTRQDIA